MDESHKKRVSEELEARTPAVTEETVNSRVMRTRSMALAADRADMSGMLVESQQDIVQLDQLRAYAQQLKSGDAPQKEIMLTEMRTEAIEAIELAKTLPSLKSTTNAPTLRKRMRSRSQTVT